MREKHGFGIQGVYRQNNVKSAAFFLVLNFFTVDKLLLCISKYPSGFGAN